MHGFGCRVIQKAIDHIADKESEQTKFMAEINNHLMELIQNQNGNHVVQKTLETFHHTKIEKLAETLVINVSSFLSFSSNTWPFICLDAELFRNISKPIRINRTASLSFKNC